MKLRKFFALLLTICMIGGMLPTAFASVAEPLKLEYDFACTALLKSDGTSNGETVVRDGNLKFYTVNEEFSASWKYVAHPGVNSIYVQPTGLLFYTANKDELENSNAIVLSINIPTSGTYSPSVVGLNTY
ncbi:MAG: hypothetical protein IJP38_08805 [Oscillospiraceae bacterium]|nr:hypothetical protein [Oscillospiraceae bacterium]